MVRVVLVKSERDAANCWRALLEDAYEADPWAFQNMEKKLTLERFQREVNTGEVSESPGKVSVRCDP